MKAVSLGVVLADGVVVVEGVEVRSWERTWGGMVIRGAVLVMAGTTVTSSRAGKTQSGLTGPTWCDGEITNIYKS